MDPEQVAIEHALELLEPFGGVTARRMFGGYGLFREGLMFALMAEAKLYLKADDVTRADFEALDLPPFTYRRGRQEASMDYFLCPEHAFASPGRMQPWAGKAFQAAVRKDEAKPPSKRKRQMG